MNNQTPREQEIEKFVEAYNAKTFYSHTNTVEFLRQALLTISQKTEEALRLEEQTTPLGLRTDLNALIYNKAVSAQQQKAKEWRGDATS